MIGNIVNGRRLLFDGELRHGVIQSLIKARLLVLGIGITPRIYKESTMLGLGLRRRKESVIS
jgi:hypothetical protein